MKRAMLALPAAVLIAATATAQTGAQTETTTEATTETMAGERFGTNWSLSVGTTFFTDGDSATLRSTEDITTGWQSLSQEDRDMILADCKIFLAAHGDTAAEGSGAATTTDGSAGTAAGPDTSAAVGADAATTAAAGYDMAEMKAICEKVDEL
jgi:hypothetical protein